MRENVFRICRRLTNVCLWSNRIVWHTKLRPKPLQDRRMGDECLCVHVHTCTLITPHLFPSWCSTAPHASLPLPRTHSSVSQLPLALQDTKWGQDEHIHCARAGRGRGCFLLVSHCQRHHAAPPGQHYSLPLQLCRMDATPLTSPNLGCSAGWQSRGTQRLWISQIHTLNMKIPFSNPTH